MSNETINVICSMTNEQQHQIFAVLEEKDMAKREVLIDAMPRESMRIFLDLLETVMESRKEAADED